MSFLFPAMLGALGAIGVPIAIHLLNKFRVRTTDWGAMRFLRDSLCKNERRLQIEDLILLIIRCVLVALLVFAFSRPVLKALVAGNDTSGPTAAVVLLDNSASMLQGNGAGTRFDDAKREIREWIEQRPSGSLAALYLVSDQVEPVIAIPGSDFALFRKVLDDAQPGAHGTDLAAGLRTAYQMLAGFSGHAREIRVYTDDQTCAWTHLEDIRRLTQDNPDIVLKPVIIGKAGEPNLGITELTPEGGVLAANVPGRFQIKVSNFGVQAVKDIHVSLAVDGAATSDESVISDLEPGTTQALSLVVTFPSPGFHTVEAVIPPDALAIDNRRTTAVQVISHMNALIVEGGHADSNLDRDGYFLANALVPVPPDEMIRYYLGLTVVGPEWLDKPSLRDVNVVFLCNPGAISAKATAALRDYVASGGSIVIFPGPLTDLVAWQKNDALWDLLPATLAPVVRSADAAMNWQGGDFTHSVTALWNNPAQGSLGTVRSTQYFPLALKPAPSAQPKGSKTPAFGLPSAIASFANGAPSVAEWSYGKGHVVLFDSTATPDWSNLPLHPAFVPLLQRLMSYLNRTDDMRLVLAPGDPFRLVVSPEFQGKELSVEEPRGSRHVVGPLAAEGEQTVVRYTDTEKTGAYRLYVGQELIGAFAVQLDPRESDLRQTDPSEIEALAKPASPPTGSKVAPARLVVTHEYWDLLIWIAALLALMEGVLAHRFSQPK